MPEGTTRLTQNAAGDKQPHAVVIGSGFGGLAAAIRLGVRGWRVTVLEKLDAPGGRAYVYRQDGFTFDAGPTIVTAPFLFEELWTLCGKRMADHVELRPVDPFYRIRFQDGAVFDCSGDPERMRAEVARFSPGDVAGYDAFMKDSEAIFRTGFEELVDVPFSSFMDMVKILPDLVRLKSWHSVYGLVAKHIKDERLRIVFSFHPLLVGGDPMTASSIYCLIAFLERHWGVHFAMGGTGALVTGMAGLIAGQGNVLRCNAEVKRINVAGGRATGVTLASGEVIESDIVVSNADSSWTYKHLVAPEHRKRWTDAKIKRTRSSMGLFLWYFGTNRTYPDVPHHTILLGPRYRELLRNIFKHHTLSDDFSLYLHRPTATDTSLAPPGCDAFYVLSPVPHLESGTNWLEVAESYRQSIARALEDSILPGLEASVVTSRTLTPQDFQDRLSSYRGAAFSVEPTLLQSAWFRPNNKSEDVKHLYLVGAGTHPGAGLPGVLSSARVLDKVVPDVSAFV
jgi:phytoene desaturase